MQRSILPSMRAGALKHVDATTGGVMPRTKHRVCARKAAHMMMSSTEIARDICSSARRDAPPVPALSCAAAVGAARAEQLSTCA